MKRRPVYAACIGLKIIGFCSNFSSAKMSLVKRFIVVIGASPVNARIIHGEKTRVFCNDEESAYRTQQKCGLSWLKCMMTEQQPNPLTATSKCLTAAIYSWVKMAADNVTNWWISTSENHTAYTQDLQPTISSKSFQNTNASKTTNCLWR